MHATMTDSCLPFFIHKLIMFNLSLLSLESSFVVFLFYFPGDMHAAISCYFLAVVKLFTVVGKACSEAAEKEC